MLDPVTLFNPDELTVIVPPALPERPVPLPLLTLAPFSRLIVRLPKALPETPLFLVVSQFSVALPTGLNASLHAAFAVPG
ncbi:MULTISPECIES: hypothetical protein [Xanthobacter]|uniref:hypothetical protein n=1 Tax=Xanthobacter TaxID=279 RepID=UPI00145EBE51|nr:hypothetical protein [Xanthobacter sp. SG618]NMN60621.1 hypothetical protein [Xanthobacter sp. SG618]